MIPSPFTIAVDHRERVPHRFAFGGIRTDADRRPERRYQPVNVLCETVHLVTGDYSIRGCEDRVTVERKGGVDGTADLYGTIGQGRKRFTRQLERMQAMDFAAVVVEADWRSVLGLWPPGLATLIEYLNTEARGKANGNGSEDHRRRCGEWINALAEVIKRPPARSQLPPKNLYRTVLAWMVRYPRVQWLFVPGRAMAEVRRLHAAMVEAAIGIGMGA